MTIENQLKLYILDHFKSLRAFVEYVKLPYNTVNGILNRGINNANSENVFKICKALQISADELGNGRITPIIKKDQTSIDLKDLADYLNYLSDLDGKKITDDERKFIQDTIDIMSEQIRRQRTKEQIEESMNRFLEENKEDLVRLPYIKEKKNKKDKKEEELKEG